MIIKKEIALADFEPWCGAIDVLNEIVQAGKAEELELMLEELYGEMTETELNDILWFESEWIFETLGIEEEEEEEEEEE